MKTASTADRKVILSPLPSPHFVIILLPFQMLPRSGEIKIFTREYLDGCKIAYIDYYRETCFSAKGIEIQTSHQKKKALAAYIIYGKSIKLAGLFSFRDYKQN